MQKKIVPLQNDRWAEHSCHIFMTEESPDCMGQHIG